MICPKCGKETNGSHCWNCGIDLRSGWQLFDLPELNEGFFTEPPAGSESSTGRFSLPPDAAGGGFTISLPQDAVSPAELPAAEPPAAPVPPVPRRTDEKPPRPQPARPAAHPKQQPEQPPQTVPQGFFLVPEPEKTLWGNFKRMIYKLLDYKGLVPALILLIFVLGIGAGWSISRRSAKKAVKPEDSAQSSTAENSAEESSQAGSPASLQKTEEDPALKQYFSDELLPQFGYIPNGQDVSAYRASGIISAVNDGGQLTVFRMADGDLQIDAYEKNGQEMNRLRGTTSREFLKRVYDAAGTVTVTADSKGVYLDGRQIWKHGLGASFTSPVTICTCMKRQDADRWERAAYLFADSTNIRAAVPDAEQPAGNTAEEPPQTPAEPERWRALYAEKLNEQFLAVQEKNSPDWDGQFALCYVDDDDIPELLLDIQQTESGYDYFSLYVISGDEVVRLNTAGGINSISVSNRTNQVRQSGYRAEEYVDYYFEYHIDGTELVQDYGRWISSDGGYYVNGEPVSEAEYDNLEEERVSPDQTLFYHLDPDNIAFQCE